MRPRGLKRNVRSSSRVRTGAAVVLISVCVRIGAVWAGGGTAEEAKTLVEQSGQLYREGKYAQAQGVAQRAVEIDERVFGADHPDTAAALLALATAYRGTGAYTKALPLAERALVIREKASGSDSPETAAALYNLSEVYRGLGEYAKALPLAQHALGIRERTLGSNHLDTALSRNDLGLLYYSMGNDKQAFELIDQALRVREKQLPPDSPDIAESLNNLAVVFLHKKMYAEALTRFERALAIKERAYGPDHPLLGTSHTNLAVLYLQMGKAAKAAAERDAAYNQALEHAMRARAILGKADPKGEQLNTAKALINLGLVLWQMAPLTNDQVRDSFQQALTITEKLLGPEHPESVQTMVLLAVFHEYTGNFQQALSLYEKALPGEDRTLANLMTIGDEEQKLALVRKSEGHYLAALSLVHRHFAKDPAAVRFALELVLRRKGIILDVQARTQEAIAQHLEGPALEAWRRLTQDRTALSKLLLGGPGAQTPAQYRSAIENLQAAIKREEQSLGPRSALVAQELGQRNVTAQAVAGRLSPDDTLVEFVRIPGWDAERRRWDNTARYVAFVLTPDNQITLVDLGDAAAIDAKIAATLTAIKDPHAFDDPVAYKRKTDAVLAELYALLVRPLDATLGARQHVIVSPDGELNEAPLQALRTPDGHYLVEQRTVSFVTSGRDLLRQKTGIPSTMDMLLVANPAFDAQESGRGSRAREPAPRVGATRSAFGPLPGTAEEAETIQPLIQGSKKVLVGKAATESAVRETKSPHVLHLATHGYFLRIVPTPASDPLGRGDQGNTRVTPSDPLHLSGMALAGANNGYLEDCGDGILCAFEVEGMDLYGTDLVVLSACETALGDVEIGEGVYGLRRAFVLAGARNLVMSLWPVDDEVTRDLMGRFYRNYRSGVSAADAMRKAELETISSLREAGKEGGVAMVTLWAPFIVQQTGQ
jgi:CHAT domain-containing protein